MKNLYLKFSGVVAALALLVTSSMMNVTCALIMHQPKMPEGAKKLRKF